MTISREKLKRLISNRRGLSPVISSVMLTGFVLILGLGVISWANSQTALTSGEYAETVDSNLEQIKEKVIFEYLYYNVSSQELTVYIMNSGQSDAVTVTLAIVSNSSWHQMLSDFQLRDLSGELIQDLDVTEEGSFKLQLPLKAGEIYVIRVITGRGRAFETTFVG